MKAHMPFQKSPAPLISESRPWDNRKVLSQVSVTEERKMTEVLRRIQLGTMRNNDTASHTTLTRSKGFRKKLFANCRAIWHDLLVSDYVTQPEI